MENVRIKLKKWQIPRHLLHYFKTTDPYPNSGAWRVRNKLKWAKQVLFKKQGYTIGSVMPSSVKDRFNESGEELYFFTKSKKYFFDLESVRLRTQTFENRPRYEASEEEIKNYKQVASHYGKKKLLGSDDEKLGNRWMSGTPNYTYKLSNEYDNQSGKNLPSIWQIGAEPHNFKRELNVEVDHFAAFPEALVEIPLKAGCPEQVCVRCGKIRKRIMETNYEIDTTGGRGEKHKNKISKTGAYLDTLERKSSIHKTLGWSDCKCGAGFHPGLVLDCFMGSGTTALVAKKLGRNYLGIELNPEYCKIAEKRIAGTNNTLF